MNNTIIFHIGRAWAALLVCMPLLFGCEKIDSADTIDSSEQGIADVNRADFFVGGQTIGLKGSLTVSANGISKTIDRNGGFQFDSTLHSGTRYEVKIDRQPDNQVCFTRNYNGKITHSDINSLVILCYDFGRIPVNAFSITAEPWNEQARLTWQDLGATEYNVYYSDFANIDINNWQSYLGEGLNTTSCHTSPCVLDGLTNGRKIAVIVEAVFAGNANAASSVITTPVGIEFDGQQKTMKSAHGRLYVGGDFTMAGYRVQNLVQTDIDSTSVSPYLGRVMPNVGGNVNAIVSDTKGGWYIGGQFGVVDDVPITGLAHILPDGQLDLNWRYDVAGYVNALAIYKGKLYVGGEFASINKQSFSHFAIIGADGTISSPLVALGGLNYSVNCIAIAPSLPYPILVGGAFTALNRQTNNGIVAIDSAGNVSNWKPAIVGSTIKAVAVVGSRVFAGGYIAQSAGNATVYTKLAAFDTYSGANIPIDAGDTDGPVNTLAAYGNTLFVGGEFQMLGVRSSPYLAALTVDTTTSLSTWSANIPVVNGQIYYPRGVKSLVVDHGNLYVGGTFNQIGGQTRSSTARFDLSVSGWPLTSWDTILGVDSMVNVIAVHDQDVLLGGAITKAGGVRRNHLAALDANGYLTAWNPIKATEDYVEIFKIDANSRAVYFTGNFESINGHPRPYLASADTAGTVLPFDLTHIKSGSARYLTSVNTFTVTEDTVYASTTDTTEGYTYQLRALDAISGYSKWASELRLNNPAQVIAFFQNRLIIGGANLTASQPYLVAYDSNGVDLNAFLNVNLFPNRLYYNSVDLLHTVGDRLFVSGSQLWPLGNNNFANVATLDAQLAISPWSASLSNSVTGVGMLDQTVYMGGNFFATRNVEAGTIAQSYAAGFDAQGALLETWRPQVSGGEGTRVDELAINGRWIYLLGNYGNLVFVNGQPRDGFAALDTTGNLKRIEFIPPPWTAAGR